MYTASNPYFHPNQAQQQQQLNLNRQIRPHNNADAQMIESSSDRRSNNNWEYLNEDDERQCDYTYKLQEPPFKPEVTPPSIESNYFQAPAAGLSFAQPQFPPHQQLPVGGDYNNNLFSLNHTNQERFLEVQNYSHNYSNCSNSNNLYYNNNSFNQSMPPQKPAHRRVVSDVTGCTGNDFDFSRTTFPPVAAEAPAPMDTAPAVQVRMVSQASSTSQGAQENPSFNLPEPHPPHQQQTSTSSNDPIMSFLLNNDKNSPHMDYLRGEVLEQQQQQQQQPQKPKRRGHRRVASESNVALFGGPMGPGKRNRLFGNKGMTDVMMELANEPGPLGNANKQQRSLSDDMDVHMKPPTSSASPSIMAAPGPAIPEHAPLAAPLPAATPSPIVQHPAIRALPNDGPMPPPRPAIRELPPQDTFTDVSATLARVASSNNPNSGGPSPAVQQNMQIQVQASMANRNNAATAGAPSPFANATANTYATMNMTPVPAASPLMAQLQQQQQQQHQHVQAQAQAGTSLKNAFAAAGVPPPAPTPLSAPNAPAPPAAAVASLPNTADDDNFNYMKKSSMNKVEENQELWDHHIHTTDNIWLETLSNIEVEPLPSEEFIVDEME